MITCNACNVVVVIYVLHSDKENGQCNSLNQFEATEDMKEQKRNLKTYNSNSFGFSFYIHVK